MTVGNKFKAKNKYSFVVKKEMAEGQAAPEGAQFIMQVTNGEDVAYKGEYYLSKNGGKTYDTDNPQKTTTGEIVLEAGWAAKIFDAPTGTTFRVEENAPDSKTYNEPTYTDNENVENDDEQQVTVSKANPNGEITVTNSLKTVPATVENAFMIEKSVSGREWGQDEKFSFKVSKVNYKASEFSAAETNGENYEAMPLPGTNGVLEISRPDNGSNKNTVTSGTMTFNKAGVYTYRVVEDLRSGIDDLDYSQAEYEVVVMVTGPDTTTAKLSATVEVRKVKDDAGEDAGNAVVATSTASFVNSVKTGTLTLTKKVAGTAANKDQHFTFSIKNLEAGDMYTADYDGNDGEAESQHQTNLTVGNDGILSVNLKHNETVTIEGLPGNAELDVTENVKGLQVSNTTAKTGENGLLVDVTADEGKDATDSYPVTVASNQTTAVTFTNTTDHAPSLGISSNIGPLLGLLATAGIGGTALAVTHRPRGKHARHGSWKE